MARQTKAQKQEQARIDATFYKYCNCIPINVFDLAKVTKEGRRLIALGANDEQLGEGMRAFCETIRADVKPTTWG